MKECDLVMKGGVSSGIVYPKAVSVLSKKYRFRNIGGTSAGAIGAAFAAAAEYQRQNNSSVAGFELLDQQLPAQIGQDLMALFQPYAKHKKVFKALMSFVSKKKPSKSWFLVKNFFKLRKFYLLPKTITETEYGLCSGLTTAGSETMGLTDWLQYWLEKSAGRLNNDQLPQTPITFSDLKLHGINLQVISTNISTQQSISLPFSSVHYAKLSDLKKLLPQNVVSYLVAFHDQRHSFKISQPDDLVVLPDDENMPVIMAIRMSLSFPVLLAAFPIYQIDWSRRNLSREELKVPRLCWFSDGGISSNFPIHLFDEIYPMRPTFGIALNEFHPDRQDPDLPLENPVPGRNRVFLPTDANAGISVPINPIEGLFSFLGAVFYAAQNWQDNAQTKLPGYRDRVVNIALKDEEGGLNLTMDKAQVGMLAGLGGLAAEEIIEKFEFDEHRWRRLLSAYAAFEREFNDLYTEFTANTSLENMQDFLERYQRGFATQALIAESYKPRNQAELLELIKRATELAEIAERWHNEPIRDQWGGNGMPKPTTALRLVPGDTYGL